MLIGDFLCIDKRARVEKPSLKRFNIQTEFL